jgi:peptidoglycan glycosyltransferase
VLTRAVPLALVLIALLGAGVVVVVEVAGSGGRSEQTLVRRYLADWSAQRWSAMYAMLSPGSQAQLSAASFANRFTTVDETATLTALNFGRRIRIHHDSADIAATVDTREFGILHERVTLALASDGSHLVFGSATVFPGLRAGETLTRTSVLGTRGTIEASDGTPLAEGPQRTSPIPEVAEEIVGTLGPIPAADRRYYRSLGYPANAEVGANGLELIFQKQLGGTPGGKLLAGTRVLADVAPVNGATVRSTINPALETDAISALGGQYASMSILNEHTGAIEAAAGQAFTDLQPPGSTFKIITTAAALAGGVATPDTVYPMESEASVGGFEMQNANSEVCGGSLNEAFATSCDTTFAPLGIQVGGTRLVTMAERFGFNQPTRIPTALESTIPSASTIGDATAVGATAIGQGDLEASTLEMADVGATIANGGRRPIPTFFADAKPTAASATSSKVAAEIQTMMQDVVSEGTGESAAIAGYHVAGKTGTAELATTAGQANDVKDTDAWFVGYVPDSKAGIVACALFPNNGYGADSAAPAVREVLADALGVG